MFIGTEEEVLKEEVVEKGFSKEVVDKGVGYRGKDRGQEGNRSRESQRLVQVLLAVVEQKSTARGIY